MASQRLKRMQAHDPRRAARLTKWADQRTTYSLDAIQSVQSIY